MVFHAIVLFVAIPSQPTAVPAGAPEALEVRILPELTELPGAAGPDTQAVGEGSDPNPGAGPSVIENATSVAGSRTPAVSASAPTVDSADAGRPVPPAGSPPRTFEPAAPAEEISPDYPPGARRRRQEGFVRLRLAVDALGTVQAVSVLESSGVPDLDSAALKAAATASFRPARTNGTAVASSVRVTVVFALEADS